MKIYVSPVADIYRFRLEDDVLQPSAVGGEYGGDTPTEDSGNDPFGD